MRLSGSDLGARRRALVLRAPGLVALPVQQRRQLQRHVERFSLLLARLSHLAASNRRGSFSGLWNQRMAAPGAMILVILGLRQSYSE